MVFSLLRLAKTFFQSFIKPRFLSKQTICVDSKIANELPFESKVISVQDEPSLKVCKLSNQEYGWS